MISNSLDSTEYNPYYKAYIDRATHANIGKGLKENLGSVVEFYSNIASDKHDYAYATGKWTIKDILLHIIDTERIFAYRVLRIARNDATPMVGFDQDDYVDAGHAKDRTLESLIKEYSAVRQATISLFDSFSDNTLKLLGEASGSNISVRAIGYIITGHENHHNQIIKDRYL